MKIIKILMVIMLLAAPASLPAQLGNSPISGTLDHDQSAYTDYKFGALTVGTTYQTVAVNGVTRAIKHLDSAGNIGTVEVLNDAAVTDYGNAATVGSIAWAISQVSGTVKGEVILNPGTYPVTTGISLTTANSGITIRGLGLVTLDGGNASIYGITINDTDNLTLSNLKLTRFGTGAINLSAGIIADIDFDKLNIFLNGIGINIAGTVVSLHVHDSYIEYNTSAGVKLQAASNTNAITFRKTRFEVNSGGAYDASAVSADHTAQFYDCIIESNPGAKAVNLDGGNPKRYSFEGCHFENNGEGTTTAYDIYFGATSRGGEVANCMFAALHTDVTVAAYSIYLENNVEGLSITNNKFAPSRAGYLAVGFAAGSLETNGVKIENNVYDSVSQEFITPDNETPFIQYSGNGTYAAPDGFFVKDAIAKRSTADATATSLWEIYYFPADTIFYITADVVGVAADGSISVAYTRKVLASQATGANPAQPTIIGTGDTTTIESDAAMDCAFGVSTDNSGTLRLLVTGKAATTIKWRATVNVIAKKWTN